MMTPVTYGYARVSKSDRDDRNLETQLRELAKHGIREELIFSDVMTGRLMSRPGWDGLMARIQPNDTIVLVWLDRFSRNFDEGVRNPGGPHRPEHRHSGHQGRDRHDRRRRRGQVPPPDDDGQRCLPGGFHQRAHKGGPRACQGRGEAAWEAACAFTRPGERVQANVRGEPVGEPCGQDHERSRGARPTGQSSMKVQRKQECNDWSGPAGLRLSPNPAPATLEGRGKALQTAVAP